VHTSRDCVYSVGCAVFELNLRMDPVIVAVSLFLVPRMHISFDSIRVSHETLTG
jgi:hypothetical protein